jgi:hypothetical protein
VALDSLFCAVEEAAHTLTAIKEELGLVVPAHMIALENLARIAEHISYNVVTEPSILQRQLRNIRGALASRPAA